MTETTTWIDTKIATPTKSGRYIVTTFDHRIDILYYNVKRGWLDLEEYMPVGAYVIAWAHPPTPYKKPFL